MMLVYNLSANSIPVDQKQTWQGGIFIFQKQGMVLPATMPF